MHPDVHLVRTGLPILDVPPLVWIDPPGAPKVCTPSSAPLWEWSAPPPRRRWRVAVPPQIALAVVAAMSLFAIAFAAAVTSSSSSSSSRQLRALAVPGEPIWCACVWWPSGPAPALSG
jgi:hypothetical protein